MKPTECEYDNVQHDCTGIAEWRIWADVTMEFHGACSAAVDALTVPAAHDRSPSGAASRGAGRINLVVEALR